MSRRRKYVPPLAPGWAGTEHAVVNGRHLTPGPEVSIRGERGRFRFIRAVTTPAGRSWLDFWGGPKGHEMRRSFGAHRVRTVHRKNVTGRNLLRARQEAG